MYRLLNNQDTRQQQRKQVEPLFLGTETCGGKPMDGRNWRVKIGWEVGNTIIDNERSAGAAATEGHPRLPHASHSRR